MTDVTADYLALRREAAAVRVSRDVIRAFGPDSVSFLQGQLSQDVAQLGVGESAWSLLLEPQGKLVAWIRVWGRRGDEVLMDVEGGSGQRVLDRLNRFRLRVATELELLDWECVAVRGARAVSPEELGLNPELRAEVGWPGLQGLDLLGPTVALPDGVHHAGIDAFTSVRIESGWPAMGAELPLEDDELVIPAEVGRWFVDRSVSFTKGCYTGQELVARVDSRGSNTPRKLRGLVVGTNVIPPVGAQIVVDGEVRGTVTSVGESLDLRAPVALGFVHRSVEPPTDAVVRWATDGGAPVEGGDHTEVPAQIRELPLIGD